jgi:signal transduction histidine kinase
VPEAARLGAVAALGGAIGLFIERHSQATGRRIAAVDGQMKRTNAEPSASQWQTIFEAMADSVLVFDRDGRILQTNAAERALLGLDSRLTRLPMTIYERGHMLKLRDDQDWPLADERSPYLRVLRGETLSGHSTAEVVMHTLDGRDVDVSISGAPIFDTDGAVIGGVVVTRDVSRHRRSQRELREANRRLEEFLAVAAHELRTPATSSIGYIQLASKRVERLAVVATAENADLSASIGNVRGNLVDAELGTQRLARLVDRLLDVARIRASKLELALQPVNLAALVDTSVHEHRLANPTRVIRCDLPMSRWVPTTADPDRIEQALANYLANALRYSPPDRPVAVELTANEREVRVIVRDEGPGVPESELERIWSSYEQGEGARQQVLSNTGLGLGLYISRAIVEAHGGKVGVESALGHGSTFWFSLPVAHLDA